MTWHGLLFPLGIIFCVVVQRLWKSLDKGLDSFQGFAFLPEERARELEQHLWGPG